MGRSRPPPGSTRGSHPDPFPPLPPPAVPEQSVTQATPKSSPAFQFALLWNSHHCGAKPKPPLGTFIWKAAGEGTISEPPRTRRNTAAGNILKINVQLCKPNLRSLGREAPRGRGQELRRGLPVTATSRSCRFQPRHAPTPPPRSVTQPHTHLWALSRQLTRSEMRIWQVEKANCCNARSGHSKCQEEVASALGPLAKLPPCLRSFLERSVQWGNGHRPHPTVHYWNKTFKAKQFAAQRVFYS